MLQGIEEPLCVLVRMAEGIVLPQQMEVPIPVRFVFLLLAPDSAISKSKVDPHEVGRSFSTMMSNAVRYGKWHTVYQMNVFSLSVHT